MTEPIEPTPEGEIRVEAPTGEEPVDDEVADLQTLRKVRREAASLRQRLHALETEHEGTVTRLSAMEHAEVERIASEHLIDPTDVWRQQPDLQSYYDEEFQQIVPDKVREATAAIIQSKPHLARPQRPPTDQPVEGLKPGASPETKPKPVTWSSALRGR